jgi:carbon-monoxide dehydrogenase iron sulfur subunit
MPTKKRLYALNDRCLACRACEIACALRRTVHGELAVAITDVPPPRPRLWVREVKGKNDPVHCLQCARPKCVAACAPGALYQEAESGMVLFDADKCTGCGECVPACSFHAIAVDPDRGLAYKCDLCDGDPACAPACPTGALFFGTPEKWKALRAERRKEPVGS